MIYIASPYSSDIKSVLVDRYNKAVDFTAAMMESGFTVFSPIVHGHAISVAKELPSDYMFWQKQCEDILSLSDAMFVLMIDGWESSKGISEEIQMCASIGIPIYYYSAIGNEYKLENTTGLCDVM